jgi:hypothetical protein
MGYEIVGSAEIAEVARAVRRLGNDRLIVNNMAKEIRKAGKPITKAMKAHARATLPKRGGLNVWASRASIRVAVRRGARSAGINIVAGRNSQQGRTDLRGLDAGRVRSPAWGHRSRWHATSVAPGAFTDPVTDEGVEDFRRAITQAVNDAARQVGL